MTIHDHHERLMLATTSASTNDEGEQQQQRERHTATHEIGTFDSTLTTTPPSSSKNKQKHILLIRHGLSYMNEYIGSNGITFGGPNFTDIFDNNERELYYRDSPLSDVGREQAARLASTIVELEEQSTTTTTTTPQDLQSSQHQEKEEECNDYKPTTKDILQELELIVVSPLTRAIQTAELGLSSKITTNHNKPSRNHHNNSEAAGAAATTTSETTTTTTGTGIPVIATPLAAERLYLVSDIGRTRADLEARYGDWVDFRTGFPERPTPAEDNDNDAAVVGDASDDDDDAPWWYQSNHDKSNNNENYSSPIDNSEWRPTGEGQSYFCPGEPYGDFQDRMLELCTWLEHREETTIALVGHFGVFEWLLQKEEDEKVEFSNCEMRVVSFDDILENVRCRRR